MSAAFFKAAIPEPFVILGLRLKPFSLGHYILMNRFEVAFVAAGEATADIPDLVLGVLICSKTYDDFLAFIDREDCQKQVEEWGEKIGMFEFVDKVKIFSEYIAHHSEIPKFVYETETTESGGQWAQAVLLSLTGQLGYSREEALNIPLSEALTNYFKHAENQGLIRLMTADEIAACEEMEKETAHV